MCIRDSPQARQDVQNYRAQAGAILSTSKTVIEDNASLNVRWSELPGSVQTKLPESEVRQPVRVVLDRQQQLSSELKFYSTDGERIVVSAQGDVAPLLNDSEQIDLKSTFANLVSQHNINHLWVEAGATLASSLIKEGLVDELVLYLAPKIMGSDGRGLFGTLGLESMAEVIELDIQDIRQVGQDIRLVARLKNKEA